MPMEKIFLTVNEKVDMLRDSGWGQDMTRSEMERVAGHMEAYRARKGSVVFKEGAPGSYMCAIGSGSVTIVKEDGESDVRRMDTRGPGRFVGEMAIIDGSPRTATALADEDTVLLIFTREQFDVMVRQAPLVGVKVVMKLARAVSRRLRRTSGVLVDLIQTAI